MNSSFHIPASDSIVLVTAGASGIGRQIARAFLAGGASVYLCDKDADALQVFLADHAGVKGIVADVADACALQPLVDEIQSDFGRLDVLINNAGIAGPTAAVEEISIEDWDRTIAVDLNGQFYTTRLAVPLLKASRNPSIINIASNAAFFGFPLRSPYTACKWAMIGLTKTWAMELGPLGIRVNAICPGSVEGERINRVIARDAEERGVSVEALRHVYARQSSLRRFVTADDVANLALFLASPLGANISGQALGLDGHTEGLANWLSE